MCIEPKCIVLRKSCLSTTVHFRANPQAPKANREIQNLNRFSRVARANIEARFNGGRMN